MFPSGCRDLWAGLTADTANPRSPPVTRVRSGKKGTGQEPDAFRCFRNLQEKLTAMSEHPPQDGEAGPLREPGCDPRPRDLHRFIFDSAVLEVNPATRDEAGTLHSAGAGPLGRGRNSDALRIVIPPASRQRGSKVRDVPAHGLAARRDNSAVMDRGRVRRLAIDRGPSASLFE